MISKKNRLNRGGELHFATTFTLFLLSITVILGIAISLVVFFGVDSLVRENRQKFILQEMQGLSHELNNFITARNSVLKDYANFPIMTQTVMQPRANLGNIQDFMDDLSLLGSKVPLSLLDFSGDPIYSTQQYIPLKNVFETIESDQLVLSIVDYDKTYYWQITNPILYQGNIEGYLVANIAMPTVTQSLKLAEHSANHRIQIHQGQKIYLDIGLSDAPVNMHMDLEKLQLTLSYNTDESAMRQGRERLLFELIMYLFVIWIFIVFISNKLGRYYLIKPLDRLRLFANDLADGKIHEIKNHSQKFYEISELESRFKTMATRVLEREKSLHEAKETLEDLNVQLIDQQQQLVHSEKLASVGQLAAGVAHEINNPTGFVMGNLEVLMEYKKSILEIFTAYGEVEKEIKNSENNSIKQALKRVEDLKEDQDLEYILTDMDELLNDSINGTVRIQKIVQDLKSFSRVDDADKKSVNLNEDVIETALRLVWNELKYKCQLNKQLNPLPTFTCHPGELSQVIMNLLINASDAIEEKGEISIFSETQGANIQIKICDDGCGICKKDMLKLFDPFFTTKEIGKGTGLGLSISQGIIKKHGGTLTVSSKMGTGTCFTILLPTADAEEFAAVG